MLLLVLAVCGLLLYALYRSYRSTYKQWEGRGFPQAAPTIPFGSDWRLSLLTSFQGERVHHLYKKAAPSPYFGIYILKIPFLVIRDPEIVRLILAKEFSHFRDRQGFSFKDEDILSHHLFNLEGDRWRALRVKMSPTFTSGKLKNMFPIFTKAAEDLHKLLLSKSSSESVDIKDVLARFTMDIICSAAFGVEAQSTSAETDTELRKIAKEILRFSPRIYFNVIFLRSFPSILAWLGCSRLIDKPVEDFLFGMIKKAVEYRKENNVKRHDFLDLLIELHEKGKLSEMDHGEVETDSHAPSIEMTLELMAAQCFVFFAAGFETSSSVQSFCLYELALHPEIQDRLYKEIEEKIAKHGGVTYQAIQEMEYLDMAIHEAMRKYPTLPYLTRCCTSPFSLPAGNRIEKGDRIMIPVWSLHHDPANFPEPEKFDPERFSPERKDSIKPYSYLPFGEGPRICIGMRFGLLQTKVGLITTLRKFQVSPSKDTQIPLKFKSSLLVTNTEGPISLKVTPRQTASQ